MACRTESDKFLGHNKPGEWFVREKFFRQGCAIAYDNHLDVPFARAIVVRR